MAERRALRACGAACLAAVLVASACGGSSDGGAGGQTGGGQSGGGAAAPSAVLRLALPPDPLWEWLKASESVRAWEDANDVRIEASNPFDQFAAFAGGHADVVLINALDVTEFAEQPDIEPVIIGKYHTDRTILAVGRHSRARSLLDLSGGRLAVESSLGSTLLWGVIADALHDRELRVGGRDFELVIVERAAIADLVARGDADGCICLPDFSVPYLADGSLQALYGGRSAAEIYAEDVAGDPALLPMAEVFVADRAWYAANRHVAAALLGLWDQGLRGWGFRRASIIADYPHLFSVETDAEIDWITDYTADHDWVVSSLYISAEEQDAHAALFARMQDLELVGAGTDGPEIDVADVGATATPGEEAEG